MLPKCVRNVPSLSQAPPLQPTIGAYIGDMPLRLLNLATSYTYLLERRFFLRLRTVDRDDPPPAIIRHILHSVYLSAYTPVCAEMQPPL